MYMGLKFISGQNLICETSLSSRNHNFQAPGYKLATSGDEDDTQDILIKCKD
jgi:hypothetical protein